MKKCSKCKEFRDLSDFHSDKQKKDGLYSSCKDCMAAVYTSKEYREKRKDNPIYTKAKRKHKVKKYGLSEQDYKSLIEKHNNQCAICGLKQSDTWRLLSIDHNHETNKVRGLLCSNCNLGLGYFKDNIELLKGAIEYVKNS